MQLFINKLVDNQQGFTESSLHRFAGNTKAGLRRQDNEVFLEKDLQNPNYIASLEIQKLICVGKRIFL